MTNEEFWGKLDKLVLGFESNPADLTTKSMEVVDLLKKAFDEKLNIMIACEFEPGSDSCAHHSFIPTGFGRMYMFYSSREQAQRLSDPDHYAEAPLKAIFNNLFNRPEAVAIGFNGNSNNKNDSCVILGPYLELGFMGKSMEKPKNFVASRPGGWSPR